MKDKYGAERFELEMHDHNMYEKMKDHMHIIELPVMAMKALGISLSLTVEIKAP